MLKPLTEEIPNTDNNLTVWGLPKNQLYSQWGRLTYEEWCHKESKRQNLMGGNTKVTHFEGLVCITKNENKNN